MEDFSDKLVLLEKKGDLRASKLYLLDDIIRSIVNQIANNRDKEVVILMSMFIKMLKGGTKTEKSIEKWEEVNEEVDKLLKRIARGERIDIFSVEKAFEKIMSYANEEHNYMFSKRTVINDEEASELVYGGGKDS